jgi:WD40 repeat protein
MSPNERYVLTTDGTMTAHIWELSSGKLISTLTGHTGVINSAAFSPDSQYVITSAGEFPIGTQGLPDTNTIRLWEVITGNNVLAIAGHTESVNTVAISPDGNLAASAGNDGAVRLWYLPGAKAAHLVLRGEAINTNSLAFSPDSQSLLVGGGAWYDNVTGNSASIWDVNTGEQLNLFDLTDIQGLNFTVLSVAYSPDGKTIALGNNVGDVMLWDIPSGELFGGTVAAYAQKIPGLKFSSDGHYLLAAGQTDATLWDLSSEMDSPVRTFAASNYLIDSVAYSHDGRFIVTAADENFGNPRIAQIWDVASGEVRRTLVGHSRAIWSVDISPNDEAVATASADGTVRIWDAMTGDVKGTLNIQKPVRAVAFSPDGELLLTAHEDGTAYLWDWRQAVIVRAFIGHSAAIVSAAFSPDGQHIATASSDHTVRVWDASYTDFIAYACTQVWRDFTEDERNQFGLRDQEPTCPQFGMLAAQEPLPSTQPLETTLPIWTNIPALTSTDTPIFSPTVTTLTSTPSPTLTVTPTSSATLEWHFSAHPTPTLPDWTPIASPTSTVQKAYLGSQRGEIPTGGGQQQWYYSGQAGETLTVTVFADHPGSGSDPATWAVEGKLDAKVQIFAPNDSANFIAENDDLDSTLTESGGVANSDAQIVAFALPEDGQYIVAVSNAFPGTSGAYTLVIERSSVMQSPIPTQSSTLTIGLSTPSPDASSP